MSAADGNCSVCHQVNLRGSHAGLECASCHAPVAGRCSTDQIPEIVQQCQSCHEGTLGVLHGPMARRQAEKDFVDNSWEQADPGFFAANCNSCHVQTCLDCHGGAGHDIALPEKDDCYSCHRGYYVGADYYGMAPREDALRYQRGPAYDGEHYLKMSPDVHLRADLKCGDCHSMASLAADQVAAKTCRDCHEPDLQIIEHRIPAHMEQLECYACHSAWAAQEYGTFFIRFADSPLQQYFRLRNDQTAPDYVRSAYLRLQDAPPLGLNERGLVSPIRPQFLAYFTDVVSDQAVGEENRLLNAQWKAFFPHTVQRGSLMCDGCHDSPARFLLQATENRVYLPDKDGLVLNSFWSQDGQQVVNGSFYDRQRYERMTQRGAQYRKAYVEKWKKLAESVETSSQH